MISLRAPSGVQRIFPVTNHTLADLPEPFLSAKSRDQIVRGIDETLLGDASERVRYRANGLYSSSPASGSPILSASASAVSFGSSPSPRNSSTVTSLEV